MIKDMQDEIKGNEHKYMVYEPLYHAQEIETIKLSSASSCKVKSARSTAVAMFPDCFQ